MKVSVHRGVRGGVEAMGTSRLEAKRILQVGGPIGVLQDISSGERNLCLSVRASTYGNGKRSCLFYIAAPKSSSPATP